MKKNLFLLFAILTFHFSIYAQSDKLEDHLRKHVRVLASDSLQGRGLGTRGLEMAREYIVQQFIENRIAPLGEDYFQDFRFRSQLAWIQATNIIGIIEGSDPLLRDEYIVIGAHYDHVGYEIKRGNKIIYPGADDNASGVAALLEIGRYFAQNTDLLGRSLVLVAFDAEESGLQGSKYFVENKTLPNIRLMFSLDMIGMYEANNGVFLRGMSALKNGDRIATKVESKQPIDIRRTGSIVEKRTDTRYFGEAGIPAIHVFTGLLSPYHKPEDRYPLLDYEGMAQITLYMQELISVLSFTEELEADRSLTVGHSMEPQRVSFGITVNNGRGFHRYKDQFFRANSVYNLSTGLYMHIPAGNFLTFSQEILFDHNGSHSTEGVFRRQSLTLPLNVQLGSPRSLLPGLRLYVFGGPYYRYNFAGKYGGANIDYDNVFHDEEWGISSGIGLEVFRVNVAYTLRRAITPLNQNADIDILDSNAYFTVSFRF